MNNIHLLLLIVLLAPANVSATMITNVFALGDSYTDVGNFASIPGTSPRPVPTGESPPSYYEGGRFTNGPVWVEQLAAHFGLAAEPVVQGGTNYAFGGAQTGPRNGPPFPPTSPDPASIPSLLDQSDALIADFGGNLPANSLYAIFGGINDIFSSALPVAAAGADPTPVLEAAASNLGAVLANLESAGADRFLVLNMFDVGFTPQVFFLSTPSDSPTARAVVVEFNRLLDTVLDDIERTRGVDIIRLDLFSLFDQVIADPSRFGFVGDTPSELLFPCVLTDTACGVVGDPRNPDEVLFWDGRHLTTAFHTVIANAAIAALPEPGALSLMALPLFFVALARRR